MIKQSLVSCFLVLVAGFQTTHAEDIYIDLETTNGVPTALFGGANAAPGSWNSIDFGSAFGMPLGPAIALLDSAGGNTNVTLQLFAQAGGDWSLIDPGYVGDEANLMSDGWATTDIPLAVFIDGLAEGSYTVTVYGIVGMGVSTFDAAGGSVNNEPFLVGGYSWSGNFVPGETHFEIALDIDAGEMVSCNWAAANFGGVGVVTGFQIQENNILLGDVNCDGTIDLLDVAPFVEVLSSGNFVAKADIDQNGTVSLLDVGPFVDLLTQP